MLDAGGNPVLDPATNQPKTTTTVTTSTVANLSANLSITPLTLSDATASTLPGVRQLDSFNLSQVQTLNVTSTFAGM